MNARDFYKRVRSRRPEVAVPIAKPKAVGAETSLWFWNPARVGVTFAPEWFAKRLREFDPDLAVTWHPIAGIWLVWLRVPRLVSPICSGWRLMFPVREADGSYRPLDERVFARLYDASADKWGNGKQYFNRIKAELLREMDQAVTTRQHDVRASARDYFNHLQPSVSMYGPSNGSKCANQ